MEIKKLKAELELDLKDIKEILMNNGLLVEYSINHKKVKYISCDSRDIKKDTLFFCKGTLFREEYLGDSINCGSIAYISEKKYNVENTSYFIVSNILKAIAVISIEFYKHPDREFKKVAITGTKGKTTVTYFLNNIIQEYTKSCVGLISTIETNTGIKKEKSILTTHESIEIEKKFY